MKRGRDKSKWREEKKVGREWKIKRVMRDKGRAKDCNELEVKRKRVGWEKREGGMREKEARK